MEVQHPAAKMLVLAAHMQEQEIGDGTNLVVTFGGEALHKAEDLLRKGLKPAEIVTGYGMAQRKALEVLETLSSNEVKNVRDVEATDTKGTVMIKNADDLKSYNKSEEDAMEAIVKEMADAGVTVAAFGSGISEIALHFLERYHIMVCKVLSKFELRRLCSATGATAMVRVGKPTPEELGSCDIVQEKELGQTKIVVFNNTEKENAISTIVVRASSKNILEDQERAINDGVNVYRALCRDARLVPGGASTEMELAAQVGAYGDTLPGLEQYAVRAYAEAFEVVALSLAQNAGHKATEIVSDLYAAHAKGEKSAGVTLEMEKGNPIQDMAAQGVWDCYQAKESALKLVGNCCLDVLRVDQIIMSRPAGGPKPKGPNKNWDKDPIFG